jgi:hypothetical protein
LACDIRLAFVGIASEDVLFADTGDGVAMTFLHGDEEAYTVAVKLRESLNASAPKRPNFKARMGINLGPIKVVIDLNGHRNVIGDGINDAQRVMSFAAPGQLLVSAAYHEMIKWLKPEYEQSFVSIGRRLDKHAREHVLYEACEEGSTHSETSAAVQLLERLRVHRPSTASVRWSPRIAFAVAMAIAASMFLMSHQDNEAQAEPTADGRRDVDNLAEMPKPPVFPGTVKRVKGNPGTNHTPAVPNAHPSLKRREQVKAQRFGRA